MWLILEEDFIIILDELTDNVIGDALFLETSHAGTTSKSNQEKTIYYRQSYQVLHKKSYSKRESV